jgi:dihydroorotase
MTNAEMQDYFKTQRKQKRNLEELKTKLNKIKICTEHITDT